ncbi:unnamed protein product [Brachionus calyciflorus]|uniref:Beclin 1-associated autophagy-related key regulator n=1 Tax=Brachionus calyciflorus TaxID=104777 RepID=A0A813ST14_9BILA|nr:unnamed protein product [Brachionus calyciflorus]
MMDQDDQNEIPPQELGLSKKFNFLIGQATYQTINERKNQLQHLKEQKNSLLINFNDIYRTTFYKNELISSMNAKRNHINLLREELMKRNINNKQNQDDLNKIIGRIVKIKQEIQLNINKIDKSKEMVKKSENYTLAKINNEFNILKIRLIEYEKQRIAELNKQIFELVEIKQKEEDILQKSTRTALKDARQTVYVNGRWILANDHVIYRILKSTLPADGDYRPFINDLHQKDDKIKEELQEEIDPLYTLGKKISTSPLNSPLSNSNLTNSLITNTYKSIDRRTILSGLTHIVQFVNLAAFYLNILLPYNLPHSRFCSKSLTSDQFQNAVAKLNTNILFLSIHQHIPVTNLLPQQTLENLYHFLNYFQEMRVKLREKHAVSFPDHLVPMMDEMFTDLDETNLMEDAMPNILFSNDNEEWETVPSSNEIPVDDACNQQISSNTRNTSSTLISSVLSHYNSWFSKTNKN